MIFVMGVSSKAKIVKLKIVKKSFLRSQTTKHHKTNQVKCFSSKHGQGMPGGCAASHALFPHMCGVFQSPCPIMPNLDLDPFSAPFFLGGYFLPLLEHKFCLLCFIVAVARAFRLFWFCYVLFHSAAPPYFDRDLKLLFTALPIL